MERMKAARKQAARKVILRDLLLFLTAMTLLAVLYVISPNSFYGKRRTNPSAATTANPPQSASAAEPAAPASEAAATIAPDAPDATADPAALPAAETPAETPAPQTAAATGDFSATFPATDNGAGALLSYQSDKLRVVINKVQENDVTYFVADVWIRNIETFATAFAKNEYGLGYHEMPAAIATANQAVFAVSGDYYGARERGIVVRNGKLYRDVASDDVCVLRKDGVLSTYLSDEFSALNVDDTIWQTWSFGPALVKDGQVCDTSHSNIKVRNPRCGVGYCAPGHYCFIVVDGRQDGYSVGMTLAELAQAFQSHGAIAAYNLDGGATAQMVFQGNVVNQQTKGGRSVSDILYFAEG